MNLNNSGREIQGIAFRAATPDDGGAISDLVLGLQAKFTFHEYTDDGKALMLRELAPRAVADTITGGNVVFLAEKDEQVIGVVSIRNNAHLSLNFVAEAWHRRGISGELWALGKAECIWRGNPGRFTLRSSTYAIPVYEKWGFVKTGEINRVGGILSHPMVLEE